MQANLQHHSFCQTFTADPELANFTRQVDQAYSYCKPQTFTHPKLIALNHDLAQQFSLNTRQLTENQLAQFFAGQQTENLSPFAMNYAGHQFGHWAGQLGDGRAINLGELQTPEQQLITLQLKGAGLTPYSRQGDGLAVLRSSIREFLCAEAMHHLGIATTRSLALCLTGEQVWRDMFYNGNAKQELGAVVTRTSKSFIRFGHFQLFAQQGDIKQLKTLADYVIAQYYPALEQIKPGAQRYIALFQHICQRTMQLMVDWQRVGFVHGVMNTDNMSIIGETIDYGPYGFLDDFNTEFTPNTTDNTHKRYRFSQQPEISQWNLFQLANALYPLIEQAEPLQQLLKDYAINYHRAWLEMMAQKLGLACLSVEQYQPIVLNLLAWLSQIKTDMTLFYRQLGSFSVEQSIKADALASWLAPCLYQILNNQQLIQVTAWFEQYQQALRQVTLTEAQRWHQMNQVNPAYIFRNYLAQQVIEQVELGNYQALFEIWQVLKTPYLQQANTEQYQQKRPDWAEHKAGCSQLSCSS